ncbi:uncharacterized protein N7506_003181 [Penicillium brevicompactum]|uniref:uncharacterized protein n=1 Tax=Penicillium brevicompactum TaxID=5074 RepID=UPI00253F75F4|nr:uncharacterized protein N7506_003181 [Penicillium brevicompactum]KAJ5343357.1 hypothetical protein N7506_003181 [Penicillium brevicompactum]
METIYTQLRPDVEESVECWDDDDDLQFNEDIQFRTASSAGSITNSSFRPSGHRDSISSRRSARSDLESNAGDEDWQVPLYDHDEFAKEEAIASAKTAGIPIPSNIPKSALIGGTIKRLSSRKTRKTFVDDWSEDIELPGPETVLRLQTHETVFPDSIGLLGSVATSPVKPTISTPWNAEISTRLQSALGAFGDLDGETEGLEFPDAPTLKAPTPRSPQKITPVEVNQETEDDFNQDFELPEHHQPLELSHRKETNGASTPTLDDFDLEWSEGSIGVRVGGTARDGRSLPSSSISIASPSVSSCLTAESGDDGLDGIVLPDGPLDFNASLRKRQSAQDENGEIEEKTIHAPPDVDDFFSGIEVDGEKAFSFGKPDLNPNIKRKTEQPSSPTRRSATTLTFTSTTGSPRTRIPRLSGHERTHSTHLETVSESGAPLFRFRTSQSRLGHSSQSSTSSLPVSNSSATSPTPLTSARRVLGSRTSRDSTLVDEINPSARRLKPKRSLPSIRGVGSGSSVQTSQRAPVDRPIRIPTARPKTPVERVIHDGRSLTRRTQAPFMPAGVSETQSHNASVKGYRTSRRTNSDSSSGLLSPPNSFSRLSRSSQHESLRAGPSETGTHSAGHASKRTITKPTKRRNFGDGSELESFDDLSTSVFAESKFVKTPTGRGAPRSVRNKLSQSRADLTHGESPPQPVTSPSASKLRSPTPRFAQDTNASRNAREQRIASMAMSSKARETGSISSFNSGWKPQPISRIPPPAAATIRSRKGKPSSKSMTKPHLIKPMGSGVQDAKSVRGMRYNPTTFRWEGNENQIPDFEISAPKSPKPAPALITNVGTMQNVQTVGGCAEAGDEDDVFAGLADLEDTVTSSTIHGRKSGVFEDPSHVTGEDGSGGDSSDEGPMTEEFDVGPEFIRRQRVEEEKWRRKVDKWVGFDRDDQANHWRWIIRDLVGFDNNSLA